MATSILRLPTVLARCGISRSMLYLLMSKEQFPKPISLGARAVGWNSDDIDHWIAERIENSKASRS